MKVTHQGGDSQTGNQDNQGGNQAGHDGGSRGGHDGGTGGGNRGNQGGGDH